MARSKVTITLDRTKADAARLLLKATTTSEVIDVALEALLRRERLRADITAYSHVPPTESELQLADLGEAGVDDDTDWETVYPDSDA